MKRYYKFIVDSADKKVQNFIQNQVMNETKPDYGSIAQHVIDVRQNIYMCSTATAAYFNPKSSYYHSSLLRDRISLILDFIARYQRDDGSFDLSTCNFKSTPDTAFDMKRMTYAYNLISKYDSEGSFSEIAAKMYSIICFAANALIIGGFHTPNHRWGIAAALAAISNVVKDEQLKKSCIDRMNEYFVEPIDCTEDGEYSERSTGNYNAVVNTSMIMLYEELDDSKYLEYVDKNLNMMLMMLDADGTIFTENSLRQDNGKKEYPIKYFYQYLYMAYKSKTNADAFRVVAHKIIADAMEMRNYSIDCLHILMLYDWMQEMEFKEMGMPYEYNKYFPYSGLVRVKKGNITYSLLGDNSNFLFFQNDCLRLGMKIGVSYFEHRNFKADVIEHNKDTYIMKFRADGWYYMPFKEKPSTTDWWQMDNSKRERIISNYTEIIVEVTDIEDGIEVDIKTNGIDRIPLRVEMSLPVDGKIYADNFVLEAKGGNSMVLKNGEIKYVKDNKVLRISGGFASHEFIRGGYSEDSVNDMNFILYFTEYTNFDHKISITTRK